MKDWILPTIVTLIGGIVLFVSYAYALPKGNSYVDNKLWLGYPKNTIYMLIALQLLAVVGFFMFFVPWTFIKKPSGGVLDGKYNWKFATVLGVFLLASIMWAWSFKISKALVVVSLVVAAVASIVFVAGAAEETSPRPVVLVGTLLLGLTVILCDGVAWNARYITSDIHNG